MPELMELGEFTATNELYNKVIKENLENRVLIFNEDVTDSVIENYIMHILKWNREDKGKDISLRQKITLILNSCGGDCMVGFGGVVNVIESSITPVRVVGLGFVASMAFYIYICCNERYCTKDCVFLMHDGEKQSYSSGSKFKDVAKFFDDMDERTKQHVLKYTKITEEFYDKHYSSEYYFYPTEGKTLGCVDKIIGEDCDLDEIL